PVDALVKLLDPALGIVVGDGFEIAISHEVDLGLLADFGLPLVGNILCVLGGLLGVFGCLVGLLLSFDNIWIGGQRGVGDAGGNAIHPASVFSGMVVFNTMFSARQFLPVLSLQCFTVVPCLGFGAFEVKYPSVAGLAF